MWKDINNSGRMHYTILTGNSIDDLKTLFPNGEANEMNFALFSTSGVHGTYNTIEEAEKAILGIPNEEGEESFDEVTFLVVHPRLVTLRYGCCTPKNVDDIAFLRKLRESSHNAIKNIGFDL